MVQWTHTGLYLLRSPISCTSAYFRYWWLQNSLEDKNHSFRLLSSHSFNVRHNFPDSQIPWTLCLRVRGEKWNSLTLSLSLSCWLEFLNNGDLALIEAFIVWKGATSISKLKYLHSFLLTLLNPERCWTSHWTVPSREHNYYPVAVIEKIWRKVFWIHI